MYKTNPLLKIVFICFAFMLLATVISSSTGLQGDYQKFTFSGLLDYLSSMPITDTWVIPYRNWVSNNVQVDGIIGLDSLVKWVLAFFIEPINAILWFCSNIINVIRFIMYILNYILLTV